jgi:hypothetical protein
MPTTPQTVTAGHLTGLLGASGVLTFDASTVSHPIDALERLNCVAVHRMIAGPKPDLFVTHPWTWSSIRRVKDTMGRYLVAADPSQDEVD